MSWRGRGVWRGRRGTPTRNPMTNVLHRSGIQSDRETELQLMAMANEITELQKPEVPYKIRAYSTEKVAKLIEVLATVIEPGHSLNLDVAVRGVLTSLETICTYNADFVYSERGRTKVEDVKLLGAPLDPVYLLKKKLLRILHHVEIEEHFRKAKRKRPKPSRSFK